MLDAAKFKGGPGSDVVNSKGLSARGSQYITSRSGSGHGPCSPWRWCFSLSCVSGGFLAGLAVASYIRAPPATLSMQLASTGLEQGLFVPKTTPRATSGLIIHRKASPGPLKTDIESISTLDVDGHRDDEDLDDKSSSPGEASVVLGLDSEEDSDSDGGGVGGAASARVEPSSRRGEQEGGAVAVTRGWLHGARDSAGDDGDSGDADVDSGAAPARSGDADTGGDGGSRAVPDDDEDEGGTGGEAGGAGGDHGGSSGGEHGRGAAAAGDAGGGEGERGSSGGRRQKRGGGEGGDGGDGGGGGDGEESGEGDADDSADAGEAGSGGEDASRGRGSDVQEGDDDGSGDASDEVASSKVILEGQLKSEAEYILSLARYPEVKFEPAGGPIKRIVPLKDDTEPQNDKYHVVVTMDCQVYARWQTLVNYWGYSKLKAEDPGSAMGGYTRILHCAEPDDIMHMVPTIRVDPLPEDYVVDYPPLNRPWAFVQWLARATFPERYVFMTEPDHIFLAPPPLLATPEKPVAYTFSYMKCDVEPQRQYCEDRRFNERGIPVGDIQPIGNSPVIISREMLREVVPRWDRLMRAIHEDEAASEGFGWVKEMYAFTLALANHPDGPPAVTLARCLMAHPPYDRKLVIDTKEVDKAVACQVDKSERFVKIPIVHMTYTQQFDGDGNQVDDDDSDPEWKFDKRSYQDEYPRLPLELPPDSAPKTTAALIERINEAGLSPELSRWFQANSATE
eukprot:jgi/Ulvmu1/516/UM001_0524.1